MKEKQRKEAKLINKHVLLSACARTQINRNKNGKMAVIKSKKGREKMENKYKQDW